MQKPCLLAFTLRLASVCSFNQEVHVSLQRTSQCGALSGFPRIRVRNKLKYTQPVQETI